PFTYRHPRVVQRVGYALIGPLQRLFEYVNPEPGAFTEEHISPYFWHNGTYPETVEYKQLEANDFTDWRLHVYGLVEHPTDFSLDELKALPYHEQITQHFCIQGWSGVAKWGGVQMSTIMGIVKPLPEAKWVVFYSMAPGSDGGRYYDAHDIAQMDHHLTMLAYRINDEPLSYGHGAPLRLRNELQHGFKMVKWLQGIEFVATFREVGGGYGGYNEGHEFFGYGETLESASQPHRSRHRRVGSRQPSNGRIHAGSPYRKVGPVDGGSGTRGRGGGDRLWRLRGRFRGGYR